MTTKPRLGPAILRKLLHYDPGTGIFTWKHRADARASWNTRYAGKIAGFDWPAPNSHMVYRSIRIFDWPFLAHRLAILYMTGAWPSEMVDHKNRNGLDNRWCNIRQATRAQNAANSKLSTRNKSGFKGASFHNGRWRATIFVDGKQQFLGYFDRPEDAHTAYMLAAVNRSGNFARAS